MLTLNDGRKELYQWDTGRTATVDIECDVVHFSNLKYGESLAVEVKAGVVSIPNKLLMIGEPIYCWAFVADANGNYTKQEQTLNVNKRAKPSDYVYTETETLTWKSLDERITELEKGGTTSTMTGATADTDGAAGLVPAPKAGEQTKFLRGDGTWVEVPAGGGTGTVKSVNGIAPDENGNVQVEVGQPTDEQISNAVETWLDEHPEATTTIDDGSITTPKLADDAVTPAKIENAIEYNQIFSKEVWANNEFYQTYINSGNGTVTNANTSYRATDFLPAKSLTVYTMNGLSLVWEVVHCYDASESWLGKVDIVSKQFTTLENTAYIRLSLWSNTKGTTDDAMICEGGMLYSDYFYGRRYALPNLDFSETGIENSLSGEKLKDNTVTGEKLLDGSVSRHKIGVVDPDSIEGVEFVNLFAAEEYQTDIASGVDTDKVLRGWLQSNSTLYTASQQYTTILIPCKPNTEYSLYKIDGGEATAWSFQGRIGFRNVNKEIFGAFVPDGVTFTTPDGAYEIVCTTPTTTTPYCDCQKLMLVYGSDTPEYTAHKATPRWLQANAQLANLSVVCYGDSLTQGKYPSKIASILGVTVVDAGIGGNTVAQIHDRVGNYGTGFDVVTLMCGTNDNGGQTSCPLGTVDDDPATDDNATSTDTTYASRLKRLINKIKATHPGATYIIMPPFDHAWGDMEAVADLMADIAKQYKIPYLDINHLCGWSGLDANDQALFMVDQTHENDLGAQRIAELLAGFIKQLKGA